MNKPTYRASRRLLHDNGRYALRWLPADVAAVMDRLVFTKARDPLADRAFVRDYDRRLAG